MQTNQTPGEREDESTPLARMKIFAAETNNYTIRAERIRPEIQALLEALTPQTSEEVVEAVARAIARATIEAAEPQTGRLSDAGIEQLVEYFSLRCYPEARAAIAAMPSIPQESDAEEIQIIAQELWAQIGPSITAARAADVARAIYTAMTSARAKANGDINGRCFREAHG